MARGYTPDMIIGRCYGAIWHGRVKGLPLRAYVLVFIIAIGVVLAVSGLTFYAMLRSKPSRFKLTASFLKLASFSIEVESGDRHQGGELPPGQGGQS